jgi:hypothetical protein
VAYKDIVKSTSFIIPDTELIADHPPEKGIEWCFVCFVLRQHMPALCFVSVVFGLVGWLVG